MRAPDTQTEFKHNVLVSVSCQLDTALKSTERVSTDRLPRSDWAVATSVRMIFMDVGKPSPRWAALPLGKWAWAVQ